MEKKKAAKNSILILGVSLVICIECAAVSAAPIDNPGSKKPRVLLVREESTCRPDLAARLFEQVAKKLNAIDKATLLNREVHYQPYDTLTHRKKTIGQVTDDLRGFADSCSADVVLLAAIDTFYQHGLSPAVNHWKDFLFQLIRTASYESDLDAFPDSVETRITASLRRIDYTPWKRALKNSVIINGEHSGGNMAYSSDVAFSVLQKKIEGSLRDIFNFDMAITSMNGKHIEINAGSDLGIHRHTLLRIVRGPIDTSNGLSSTLDRRTTIGYALVKKTTPSTSSTELFKARKPVLASDEVIESITPYKEVSIHFSTGPHSDIMLSGLEMLNSFYYPFMWGFSLDYQKNRDSRGTDENGFSLGASVDYRIITSGPISVDAELPLQMNISFRKDDHRMNVSTAVFSVVPTLLGGYAITNRMDLVIGAGYRYGVQSGGFSETGKSSDDNSSLRKAFWSDNKEPKLSVKGACISVSVRFPLFGK